MLSESDTSTEIFLWFEFWLVSDIFHASRGVNLYSRIFSAVQFETWSSILWILVEHGFKNFWTVGFSYIFLSVILWPFLLRTFSNPSKYLPLFYYIFVHDVHTPTIVWTVSSNALGLSQRTLFIVFCDPTSDRLTNWFVKVHISLLIRSVLYPINWFWVDSFNKKKVTSTYFSHNIIQRENTFS